jgi:hypothetical protein
MSSFKSEAVSFKPEAIDLAHHLSGNFSTSELYLVIDLHLPELAKARQTSPLKGDVHSSTRAFILCLTLSQA